MVRMTMNDKGYGIEKNDKELYGIIRVERIGKEQLGKPEKADESTDGQSSPGGLATCSNLLWKKTIANLLKINFELPKDS